MYVLVWGNSERFTKKKRCGKGARKDSGSLDLAIWQITVVFSYVYCATYKDCIG